MRTYLICSISSRSFQRHSNQLQISLPTALFNAQMLHTGVQCGALQPARQTARHVVSAHSSLASCRAHVVQRHSSTAFFTGRQVEMPSVRTHRAARGSVVVEANIFGRVSRVFRSYVNAAVSKAEDPEKILEQAVNDMQGDLIKMRQASAQVLASQKQLQVKYDQAQQTSDEWYRRAELALSKGDDDLAREALKRRKAYADNAAAMKGQVDQQKKATDQLIQNTRMLEQKLAEAKSKKDTLKARAKSASASKQITDMIQGLDTSNALTAFEKMEEKVMALESESEATLQLSAPDNLEKQFQQLEGDSVDDELAQMKRGALGNGSSRGRELPEGRPYDQVFKKDAIDEELDALRRKARE